MPRRIAVALLCLAGPPISVGANSGFDAAAAFGARPSVSDLTLSPDGMSVAWIAPLAAQGSAAYTLSLAKDARPKVALVSSGKPERLRSCRWVSDQRLACSAVWLKKDPTYGLFPYSRVVAVDIDGSNLQLLSTRENEYSRGIQLGGGEIIDWLPEADSSVLMSRWYLPEEHLGSHIGSDDEGLGVDELDTRNLRSRRVEPPRREAVEYISDGRGHVRIVGLSVAGNAGGQRTDAVDFLYHPAGSQELKPLSRYHSLDRSGFLPRAVDPELNVAYGFMKLDGRKAVYSVALDGSRREQLVYANPDVDVDQLIRIGRHNRVVGASYVTEYRQAVYFAPDVDAVIKSLARALPQAKLRVVDASVDESRMLVLTSSDKDPGVYYIFDRKARQLQTFFVVRSELEGVKLASVRPITFPAADGTVIPGYLTLPPGVETAKGLPAVVMPHGGPDARDEWGFDWLAQFFAARGYAVLQPNFRGSAGYGEEWFHKNGFRSWQVAIGDVLDGGRWLVREGIADPQKLGIVGWSYGGYAALQSAVVDPVLFKAVVAIAPVTDLPELKEEYRHWSSFQLMSEYIGDGPHTREGSPAEHADRFRAPVLLFHGAMDRNVGIRQSRLMEDSLRAAHAKCELVTWPDLDHQLEDSSARAQMLNRSDAFLRQAFGM